MSKISKKTTSDFLKHQGQTSPYPILIEVDRAEGIYIYDKNGKRFTDMIAGVAVNNIGHNHPNVVKALKKQIDKHLHVMVYGEFIQEAQLEFAKKLSSLLPEKLNSVYTVNSGTEANEAALKLAKRLTGRVEIISCVGSYHGSTHGSLSVSYNKAKKEPFEPLLPNISFISINNFNEINKITNKTAAFIIEPIQGDAGVRRASDDYLKAVRNRCDETGTLLIFDEIQCGMGRSGKLFAFEHSQVVPDILTLGKALGGGMPIGALVSSRDNLDKFTFDPMLGHITTFGGHPVICAAARAFLEVAENIDFDEVEKNGKLLENIISKSEEVIEIRREGMMFAIDMEDDNRVQKVVDKCLDLGLITFWFLSHPNSFRLSPPLTISKAQIEEAGELILRAIKETSI